MVDLIDRAEREAALAKKLGRAMGEARKLLLQAVEDGVVTDDEWRQIAAVFTQALQSELEQTALAAGMAASEALGGMVDSAAMHQSAIQFAREYTYELVSRLDSTNRNLLQQTISDYFAERLTLKDVEARLTQAFGPVRAEMIAVTETTRAASAGEQAFADELRKLGVQPVHVWNTAQDDRVCPICGPLNEKVSGEGWTFPPPAHINCVLPGTEVVAPGLIVAATKSFYVGVGVEIVLSNGSVLTVTKNHPVLTRRGWVAAELLREGDYAVHTVNAQRIAEAINPDDDHVPTRIEDVFAALVKSGEMTTLRVPSAAEHFHGDGRGLQGDIDIVFPHRFLLSDEIPSIAQGGGKRMFNRAGMSHARLSRLGTKDAFGVRNYPIAGSVMSGVEHSGGGFRGSVVPPDTHGIGDGSDIYAGLLEANADSAPRHAVGGGKCLLGFTRNVASHDFIGGDADSFPVSVSDTGATHLHKQSGGADTYLARQFLDRFSGLVTFNEVVKVRHFDVATHVYDLQVEPYSLYTGNGYVVHNCRCWLTTEVREATR